MNLGPTRFHELLSAGAAKAGPQSIALIDGETFLSFAQLIQRAKELAGGIEAATEVSPGDRIAIYLDKRVETVETLLAASALEAIFVPVNPVLKGHQVAHILEDSGTRLLITSAQRLAVIQPLLDRLPDLEAVILVGDESPPSLSIRPQLHRWSELSAMPTAQGSHPISSSDTTPAAIFYTSGSTGRPKGVVVSHRNLILGAESVNAYLGNSPEDRILAALPLSFDAGFSQLSTAFAAGAAVVLVDYLLPADVVKACLEHEITGLTCVPPLWIQLAELDWPEEAATRLRYFASTGGRMPPATLARLREIFPRALPFLMYGLTEAFRSTYLDPAEVDRRPGSIGKAIPNAEVLVLRPDGTECDPGEPGELVHRGPLVSLGYWNDPEQTARRFRPVPGRDGPPADPTPTVWSGDSVTRDEEGFLYFVERSDEMIKTSGYRVSPTEIEDAAYATGLVTEAVALGIPDQRLGQTIALVIDGGSRDAENLTATLRKELRRQLPRFMLPRSIEVLPGLPRGANGKFDRQRIRQYLLENQRHE